MIEEEKDREAARIVERLCGEKNLDLEATEFFIRSAMLKAGARALEAFFEDALREEQAPLCAKNHRPTIMRNTGKKEKTILGILGSSRLRRNRYECPVCGAVLYSVDRELGVEGTGFSPGARRMMARTGSKDSFGESADDLALYADLRVDAKDVERVAESTGREIDDWMSREGALSRIIPPKTDPINTLYISFDGTGIPMRPSELEGVRGKAEDGRAKTREVKLGCVFTQTTLNEKGRPMRDPDSTTYVRFFPADFRVHNQVELPAVLFAELLIVADACNPVDYRRVFERCRPVRAGKIAIRVVNGRAGKADM